MRVHDASQAAVSHASFNPLPARVPIAAQVLRDPTLGSRATSGTVLPAGTTVGLGSVAGNNGNIPPAVQAAIQNFGANQNTNNLVEILNRVLGNFSAPAQPSSLDPVQAQYLQSKTALNNQMLQQQQLPGRISARINELETQKANLASNPFVISPMGTYAGGAAAQNVDRQLQNLYGAQTRTSGWLPQY